MITRLFETKVNLPMGIKKGTKVEVIEYIPTPQIRFFESKETFPFNPLLEPNFFKEIVPITYKYTVGDHVINFKALNVKNTQGIKRHIDNKTPMVIESQIPPQIQNGIPPKLQYRVRVHESFIILWETDLHPLFTYWFLNSKGDIVFDYIGLYPQYEEWRKKSKNYFTSSDEAKIHKNNILKS